MSNHHKHHDELDDAGLVLFRRVAFERSADMNVTPLIDVLLVLLVIFIAALPLTQKGVDINLPLETSRTTTPSDVPQVVIGRAADRQVTINEKPVELAQLQQRLQAIFEGRIEKTVFIKGDGSLSYGEVVQLIDACTPLGLRVGLITPGMQVDLQRPK